MDANRREVLAWAGGACVLFATGARAEALPSMEVFRDPGCGCCHKWVEHLEGNGFSVTLIDAPSMKAVKARLGVPASLAACHTGEIGGYIIEGHVPAVAIKRLLAEKPAGRGIAVPGMPVGSPGMEVEGSEPEIYEVLLFGESEPTSFGRYRGDQPV